MGGVGGGEEKDWGFEGTRVVMVVVMKGCGGSDDGGWEVGGDEGGLVGEEKDLGV